MVISSRIKNIFSRLTFTKAVAIIGFVVAFAAAVLITRQQIFKMKAGIGPATLTVVPPTQSVAEGANGTIDVYLDPKNVGVNSVELVMNYDPSIIEITGLAVGPFFTQARCPAAPSPACGTINPGELIGYQTLISSYTNGTIHLGVGFSLGSKDPANTSLVFSSTAPANVATISFKGKIKGDSPITFITSGYPLTSVNNAQAVDILASATSGTVKIGSTGARLSFSEPVPANPQTIESNFTVAAVLDTAGQNVDGVDAKITFNPDTLMVVGVSEGTASAFKSYPALNYDNTAGTVNISANIGTSASPVPANGSDLIIGSIIFRPIKTSAGSTINYLFTQGDRNDSNVVLFGTSGSGDPVDILADVSPLTVSVGYAATPTAIPTPTQTPTAAPDPTPTPIVSPLATPTAIATPTPLGLQPVTVKLRFEGRIRPGASNLRNISFSYRAVSGGSTVLEPLITTNLNGEFTYNFPVNNFDFLIDSAGYLAKKFANVAITSGNGSLDLSASPLFGGDFNDDGIVNEIDYSLKFLPSFLTSDTLTDLDGSGVVNNLDFAIMRRNWSFENDTL